MDAENPTAVPHTSSGDAGSLFARKAGAGQRKSSFHNESLREEHLNIE